MFTWTWVFQMVSFSALAGPNQVLALHLKYYTCEEFEQGAHFDPYELIDSLWKIFYFWADHTEIYPIRFSLPTKQKLHNFREVVDQVDSELQVEWHKAALMMEPRPGLQILLLDAGTTGAFRAVIKMEDRKAVRPRPIPLIKFADVRLKLVGRYLGMMCCEDNTAFALARINEMPLTEMQCRNGAATLGFEGADGRSHIYIQRLIEEKSKNDEL